MNFPVTRKTVMALSGLTRKQIFDATKLGYLPGHGKGDGAPTYYSAFDLGAAIQLGGLVRLGLSVPSAVRFQEDEIMGSVELEELIAEADRIRGYKNPWPDMTYREWCYIKGYKTPPTGLVLTLSELRALAG